MELTFDAAEVEAVRHVTCGIILDTNPHESIVIGGDDDEIMDLLRKIADLFNAEVKYREDPDQAIVDDIANVFCDVPALNVRFRWPS